jgi:hypothetical protein
MIFRYCSIFSSLRICLYCLTIDASLLTAIASVYHPSLVATLSFSPIGYCLFRHSKRDMAEEACLERQSKIG